MNVWFEVHVDGVRLRDARYDRPRYAIARAMVEYYARDATHVVTVVDVDDDVEHGPGTVRWTSAP